jgi:hypothetical protein
MLADLVNGRDPGIPLGASSGDAARPANLTKAKMFLGSGNSALPER